MPRRWLARMPRQGWSHCFSLRKRQGYGPEKRVAFGITEGRQGLRQGRRQQAGRPREQVCGHDGAREWGQVVRKGRASPSQLCTRVLGRELGCITKRSLIPSLTLLPQPVP